jgi:hypothetical protein
MKGSVCCAAELKAGNPMIDLYSRPQAALLRPARLPRHPPEQAIPRLDSL